MRYESVTARAFGAFRGRWLDLAPGLNIIHGANESGKSTWHAALHLGLCGLPRGRRGSRRGSRQGGAGGAQRHRPWSGETWEVQVVVRLEDGRRVEIDQDFLARTPSRALDLDLGSECTPEILHDGTPDGARWLGLDRHTFVLTACVRQGDILELLVGSHALQEQLQRAADSTGGELTAARALEALERFRRERVGNDRAGSQRPLRAALDRVDALRRSLSAARQERSACLDLVARIDRLGEREEEAARSLLLCRATVAWQEREARRRALDRARALHDRLGDGAPPDLLCEVERRHRLRSALRAWDRRPVPERLVGADVAELRRRLERLERPAPAPASGPRDVQLAEAYTAFLASERALILARRRPGTVTRCLRTLPALALVALAGLAASRISAASWPWPVLGLAPLAGLLAFLGLAGGRESSRRRVLADLAIQRDRSARALDALLPPPRAGPRSKEQPLAATRLAERYARHRRRRQRRARRRSRRERKRMGRSLRARLAARKSAERLARRDGAIVATLQRELREAARACGLEADGPGDVAALARRWLRRREGERGSVSGDLDAHRELGVILGGRDFASFARNVAAEIEERDAALAVLDGEEIACIREADPPPAGRLEELEARARQLATERAALHGRLQEREARAPRVPELEEELAAAEAELERFRELDRTLELTRGFLEKARERVHRAVAPRLAANLARTLPAVTGQRYEQACVDPGTLGVRVRGEGGRWSDATALSHGTTEQIYLLLRAALATEITSAGEVCPLLLDDVTVHCDRERTEAVLEVLHEIAGERQVILFTQDPGVLEWALARELSDPDRLVHLEPSGPGRPGQIARVSRNVP